MVQRFDPLRFHPHGFGASDTPDSLTLRLVQSGIASTPSGVRRCHVSYALVHINGREGPVRCNGVVVSLSDKLWSLFILLSTALGLSLGQLPWLAEHAQVLILPFLMLMLVGVFLHVRLRAFGEALHHPHFTGWSLGINFLWTPLFDYALGFFFLRGQPDLWAGLIMLLVTPCTD